MLSGFPAPVPKELPAAPRGGRNTWAELGRGYGQVSGTSPRFGLVTLDFDLRSTEGISAIIGWDW